MERLIDKELAEYAYLVDDKETLFAMCSFLYQAWTNIELSLAYDKPSVFEHPVFENRFDLEEILNWENEAKIASSYALGYVEELTELGKEQILLFAMSFLEYANQTPDIFEHIGIFDDFLRAYGLEDTPFEDIESVKDWEG